MMVLAPPQATGTGAHAQHSIFGTCISERIGMIGFLWTQEPRNVHLTGIYMDLQLDHPFSEISQRGWTNDAVVDRRDEE